MNSYLSDKPLPNVSLWRTLRTIPSSRDSYFLWLFPDDTVLSIQPDGSEQFRPAGVDGSWEQCLIIGTRAIWDYDGIVRPIVYDCIIVE